MAHITLADGVLTVTMRGIDKILALRGHVSVQLAHIRGVEVRPDEARRFWHGLRVGTNIPGVVTAGTFYTGDGAVFFDVHDPERAIAIDLADETYRRLIVQVDDDDTPEATAARIRAAIGLGAE
jgi:hypothetical protein